VGTGSIEPGGGAEEREAALLVAGQGLHGHSEDLGRRAQQVFTVGGIAGGAGGGGPDTLHAGGVHDVAVLPQHRQRPAHGVGVETLGGVDTLAEPGDVHVPLDGDQRPSGAVGIGDEEPGRVGAHVDRRQALHGSCAGGSAPTVAAPS
jgi:hypothetical protein